MDVSEKSKDFSEYISEVIPEEYFSLSTLLASRKHSFTSFETAIEACLQIVSALRKLHINGLCHPSLNDSNIFIDPETGKILISDCDMIRLCNAKTNFGNSYRFMAPELTYKPDQKYPDAQSDRYTLAVILFLIIFNNHPLEGKRWLVPCMTNEYAEKLYGTDPLFVFDPEDDRNAPVPKIHRTLTERWELAPKYLKDIFLKAFSSDALTDPSKRPLEVQWLSTLMHFKNDIVNCPSCQNEMFVTDISSVECDNCLAPYIAEKTITLPDYTVIARKGTVIYKHQIVPTPANDSLKPLLVVVSKTDDPASLGLKNISGETITAITSKGVVKRVEDGGVVPILNGITIAVFGKKIKLSIKQ